jgi:pentatricopeptide repeat protein
VIGDMISLCSSSRKQSGTGNGIAHCPPTVHTWSILLKAFMDHNQPRAAEKVLAMMQSRGITPNQVTWNTLLTGYARQQDVVSTVHALERLEGDGWKVDEVTMKGLQRLHNREALMLALQRKEAKGNGARVKA